ncbi:MAG: hypothetical protein AAGF23_18125, partial [Acidobacteriota bacterium]
HGMIQAVYSAAYDKFKGDTIEVAVGLETTKLASCFACATFMCASDRPPDAIHLGRGESWAPVQEGDSPSCEILRNRRLDRPDPKTLRDAVSYANKKWYRKCASWLYYGTRINVDQINPNHLKSWRAVTKFAEDHKSELGPSANLFLDALTVHGKDRLRVENTLRETP